jgi:hypothetical protein
MGLKELAVFESWGCHGDTEGFGFVAAGHHTAVIAT